MDFEDFDEYEEDNEDIDLSDEYDEDYDEEDIKLTEDIKNSDNEEYENKDNENSNIDKKDDEDDEEIVLDEEYEEENINNLDISNEIKNYKSENISNFSNLGMISYICNIVDYIKKGGTMLDTRQTFNFPDETEESYALECILLNKVPFEYIVNKKKVIINEYAKILCLKNVLRCVDNNNSIFFTKEFVKKFPIFIKSLFINSISEEEIKEIENLKKNGGQ